MRILLVNNAGGTHEYLRHGLEKIGHEVVVADYGLGSYQLRHADVKFGITGAGFGNRLRRVFEPPIRLLRLGRFDVANLQMGVTMFKSPLIRYADLMIMKALGTRLSYYGLGCDPISLLRIRNDVTSLPCRACLMEDSIGRACEKEILSQRPAASRWSHLFDFAASSAYIYDHGLEFFSRAQKSRIQFPVNLSTIEFHPASRRRRPLIVHSPSRMGFKGTAVVNQAIELLKEKRSDFEFRLLRGLSHSDYLRAMRDCDIYVDQVHSADSYGMAALENLAGGKIVVSGNGPRAWADFPFMRHAPVIPASPDPIKLSNTLDELLSRRDEFTRLGERGRQYASDHHDHVLVARLWIEFWSHAASAQTHRVATVPGQNVRSSNGAFK